MTSGTQDVHPPRDRSMTAASPPPLKGRDAPPPVPDGETSIFDFAAVVLRHAPHIAAGMILGAALAVLPLLWTVRVYRATASFTPQTVDAPRGGLSAIAGQLGIALPSGSMNQSPQFYVDLIKTRVILAPFAHDTFVVAEQAGRRMPFTTLFGINSATEESRADAVVATLSSRIETRMNTTTGTVTVSATTPWRSVSLAITQRLLDRLNGFNLEKRQSQATNERRFIEARLTEARAALRDAENRLEAFMNSNKMLGSSSTLAFARDRLQREVTLRQDVVTTLTQSYEDVRIREVRDTPVITVIEPPSAPALPVSRRGSVRLLIGMMAGGIISLLLVLGREMFRRRRDAGDPDVDEFLGSLRDLRRRVVRTPPKHPQTQA